MVDGRGAPFYYCGPVEFLSWSGDKPITVIWRLSTAVPEPLREELAVPRSNGAKDGNITNKPY